MRNLQATISAIALVFAMAVHTGCEQQEMSDIAEIHPTGTTHTIDMLLEGDRVDYDDVTTKAGATWQEGDKLFITFAVNNTTTPGKAVYQDGSWKLTYEGELATGGNNTCQVRYFTDVQSETVGQITLDATSGIYEDLSGQYSINNNQLTVNASLRPKYGRVRLKRTAGSKCQLNGIATIGSYAPLNGTYTPGAKLINLTVGADGYTPYVYGTFADDTHAIGFIGKEDAYTRYFTEDILAAGKSGYMAFPTADAHNNWRNGLYVTVDNVTFLMIGVAGHSGGYYLMAETELTIGLYYRVKNNVSANQPEYPYNCSFADCIDFITRLNLASGFSFSLPTYDQWVYAAKGGAYSLGTIYAGSNGPANVAWYSANADNGAKKVKQKMPNELGLYDMSGNYNEWTSTLENESYAGSYRRAGGNFKDDPSGIEVDAFTYSETKNTGYVPEGAGMRLCLNVNLE